MCFCHFLNIEKYELFAKNMQGQLTTNCFNNNASQTSVYRLYMVAYNAERFIKLKSFYRIKQNSEDLFFNNICKFCRVKRYFLLYNFKPILLLKLKHPLN